MTDFHGRASVKVDYRVLLLFLLALAVAAPAGAQTFRGTVVDDSTRRPLESAMLTLLDANGKVLDRPTVRSDTAGRFVLHAGSPGRYAVRVSRIGYAPLTSPTIQLSGGGVAALNLAMSAVQQKLGTIVVTEQRRLNRFELYSDLGFELRRSKGNGKFLDTLALKEYGQHSMQSLLVDHAGFAIHYLPIKTLAQSSRGARPPPNPDSLVMFNGLNPDGSMRTCGPELWLDGFMMQHQRHLAGLRADDIYGVEVFSHLQYPPASIGADFGAEQSLLGRESRCGVIAIWTKGYINEMKAKEAKRLSPPGG